MICASKTYKLSTIPVYSYFVEPPLVTNHSTIEPTSEEVPTHVTEIPEPAVDAVEPTSVEKEIIDPPIEAQSTEAQVVVESAPPLSGDAPKISYASIVCTFSPYTCGDCIILLLH